MEPLRNREEFTILIKKLIQMAMVAFYQENSKDELKITILVTFNFEVINNINIIYKIIMNNVGYNKNTK